MIIIACLLTIAISLLALNEMLERKRMNKMIARETIELLQKQRKYHWNPQAFRYELEPHQLEALSFKEVTAEEAYDVMSTIEYNPTHHYRDKIKLEPREIGHDLKYRYIAKPNAK